MCFVIIGRNYLIMTPFWRRTLFILYIVFFSFFSLSSLISFTHYKIFQQIKNDSETLQREDTLEKVSTAYHEAGHVIVAHFLKNAPKIVSVSIVPKKGSLGQVQHEFINKSDATKDEFLDYIALCMGGRAAIEIQYGRGDQVDVGAGKDIENATNAASEMVGKFGLSHKLGMMNKLSDDIYTADTKEEMLKEEIGGILEHAFKRAKKVIKEHKIELDDLVEKLLEQETLVASEVMELFSKSAAIRNRKMIALLNIIGK